MLNLLDVGCQPCVNPDIAAARAVRLCGEDHAGNASAPFRQTPVGWIAEFAVWIRIGTAWLRQIAPRQTKRVDVTQTFPHLPISRLSSGLFRAAGATTDAADLAAEMLVDSSLMGHDSHGVLRVPEYLDFIDDGSLCPTADVQVDVTGPTTAVVDCGHNFGAVGGVRAIQVAIDMAQQQQTACVITRRCNHVGRLGAYVQMAADAGMVAIATCNSPIYGHFVLPWGGREGRLATNPIAYAIPTSGFPIVADFSTSVAPEGKIRFLHNQQQPVPDGWIVDAAGQPTNDASQFYGPPRGGILPFGGMVGYKGFALSLLVEVFGSALAGVASTDTEVFGNGVCFLVFDPAAFGSIERFRGLVSDMVAYMKSSAPAPGVDEVLLPGELEFRTRTERLANGIPIDDSTWTEIQRRAEVAGVPLETA